MVIKIMPLPAERAAEFIAPYDGIMPAVFVDQDGNPVDITGGAGTYDPVTVYDGRPMVGGRPGQDHIDPATGDLWSYEKTNENEPAAQAK